MAKKMDAEEAKRIFSDVSDEKSFWVNEGPVVKNLEELTAALRKMKKNVFEHHVDKTKNDFSTWVAEVIGDSALAKSIAKTKTKQTMINKLKERIAALKKIAG